MPIRLVDDKSLPPPPFVGLHPPDDMATRDSRKFVYGFPLPDDWFQYRFSHDLKLDGLDAEAIKEKQRLHGGSLISCMVRMCDKMEGGLQVPPNFCGDFHGVFLLVSGHWNSWAQAFCRGCQETQVIAVALWCV